MAPDGTIGWWPPGRFDAAPLFSRLLDPRGVALRVGPVGAPVEGVQSWLPGTNVVRTLTPAADGQLEVVDFMPWAGPGFRPTGRIVRLVRVLAGSVEVAAEVTGPARRSAVSLAPFSSGLVVEGAVIRTGFPVDGRAGSLRLVAGERLVVTVDPPGPDREPLSVDAALELYRRTIDAWKLYLALLTYDGHHAAGVRRSLLALKALTVARSGAVVGGPTVARSAVVDVARATAVDHAVGLADEAAIHSAWLATVMDREPPLAAVHTLDAEPAEEAETALAGPFVYAALADAAQPARPGGEAAMASMWDGLVRVADVVAERPRGAPAPMAEDLAAWHVLDRMARLAVRGHPLSLDAASWRQSANEALSSLEERSYDDPGVDPGLLLATTLAPWSVDDERVRRMVRAVIDDWEAAEGVATPADLGWRFAAVEALARLGHWDEAHGRMEPLLALADPLGQRPTSIEEAAEPAGGDRPAARTHLAMIGAALALSAGPT